MVNMLNAPDNQQYKVIYDMLSNLNGNFKVLDVGAGPHFGLKNFLPNNFTYHTLDFGKDHTYNFNLDSGKFPIKSNSYDIIICTETLEHVMYPKRVISELNRVAKKGALFFLSLPNEYNFVQRLYFLVGKKTNFDEPFELVEKHLHIHKPRVRDILYLFSKAGQIQEIRYIWQSNLSHFSYLARLIDKFINLLAQFLPNLFARVVVVRAKK